MATAYCVKCRKMVDIQDEKRVNLKNNVPALTGLCPISQTKVVRILPRISDPIYALQNVIERERTAKEFYLAAAEKTQEPTGKKMFKWLAKQESFHEKGLERQMKSALGKKLFKVWKEQPIISPEDLEQFPVVSEVKGTYEATADEVSALKQAIKAEQEAISLYRMNADVHNDPVLRNMFSDLARTEESHLRLLKRQLESVTKNGKYFSFFGMVDIYLERRTAKTKK
ncbi:ferritin family protein [Chloroflexota bacterium]